MLKEALAQTTTALLVLIIFTIITGIIYPVITTAIGQLIFPYLVNGSLIRQNNELVGSELIGQSFSAMHYFWGRPSATTPFPYNSAASAGANNGPSNKDFLVTVQQRVTSLKQADPGNTQLIPGDLVLTSGSGLDPHISPAAAFYQIPRIARERQIPENELAVLVKQQITHRTLWILGEPIINVLQLNLALDKMKAHYDQTAREP